MMQPKRWIFLAGLLVALITLMTGCGGGSANPAGAGSPPAPSSQVKTPAPSTITEYPIVSADPSPVEIAAGPDGNLWFTEFNGARIGKITPGGAITEYPIPRSPQDQGSQPGVTGIGAGPDGNLWFTEQYLGKIGKITP